MGRGARVVRSGGELGGLWGVVWTAEAEGGHEFNKGRESSHRGGWRKTRGSCRLGTSLDNGGMTARGIIMEASLDTSRAKVVAMSAQEISRCRPVAAIGPPSSSTRSPLALPAPASTRAALTAPARSTPTRPSLPGLPPPPPPASAARGHQRRPTTREPRTAPAPVPVPSLILADSLDAHPATATAPPPRPSSVDKAPPALSVTIIPLNASLAHTTQAEPPLPARVLTTFDVRQSDMHARSSPWRPPRLIHISIAPAPSSPIVLSSP